MPTVAEILNDREFFDLPIEDRKRVLRSIDESFGYLPEDEQNKVVLREPTVDVHNTHELAKTLDIPNESAIPLKPVFDFIWDEIKGIPNVYKDTAFALLNGTGSLAINVGGLLKRLYPTLGENLINEGFRLQSAYPLPTYTPENFQWGSKGVKDWFINRVIPSVPTTVSGLATAFIGAQLGAGIGIGLGTSVFTRYVLGALGASVLGRSTESLMEAQNAYDEALLNGKTEDEANNIFKSVFADNMKLGGLDFAEFTTAFVPFPFRPTATAIRGALLGARFTGSALLEGLEERIQEFIVEKANNPELPYSKLFDLEDTRENEATIIGAIFGLGLGGIGAVTRLFTQEVENAVIRKGGDLAEQFKSEKESLGLNEALNNLAESKEGQGIINEVIEGIKNQNIETAKPGTKQTEKLRKALRFPPLSKMTPDQYENFVELLSKYRASDEFLGVRMLQEIDKTDLAGLRTVREVREHLAKELEKIGAKISDIKQTANWFDEVSWDALLRQRDAFKRLLADGVQKEILVGDAKYIEYRDTLERLHKTAESVYNSTEYAKISNDSFDKALIDYLEADIPTQMEMEEKLNREFVQYASFVESYFHDALKYLVQHSDLTKSRFTDRYYPHARRGFFEALMNSGIKTAFQEMWAKWKEQLFEATILDERTGEILPLNKFFKNTLFRSSDVPYSENSARAILDYIQRFERKKALDRIIPKFEAYAQVLTPKIYTKRGLEVNNSLQRFVKKYINTRKGRRQAIGIIHQGGVLDTLLRTTRTFVSIIDLGFNIPVQLSAIGGETVANYVMLGESNFVKGIARKYTPKGREILRKYRNFTGDSFWRSFTGIESNAMDKTFGVLLGMFSKVSESANKTFLLGSMTDAEWQKGEISPERLAEIRGQMGRFRNVPEGKSIMGATSVGQMLTQYKTWAIPVVSQTIRDITAITRGTATKVELHEVRRIVMASMLIYTVGSMVLGSILEKKPHERDFLESLLVRTYQDGLSLIGSFSPQTLMIRPRLIEWLNQLYGNLTELVVHLNGKPLLKQFTPRIVKQMESEQNVK